MARRNVSLKRISPLSAFRVGLAMSLVGLVAWLIAVVLLYFGMDQFGIWESLNSLIFDVGGNQTITFGMVVSICALIGAVIAILNTILAPILALIYNAIVDLFGGIEMGLQDKSSKSTKQSKSTSKTADATN
ncbi:DUF3566 domain-containing protein [Corynebacterium sp. L4756]|uniref:DUF3566 domain-containing protein n=1 Tax=unclassified Corynebacterium TaxID=2624378 RepID=UPI00374D448E